MRRRYLVCYDICDPKRLRQVHKTMKRFGDPLQYSVFYCELSAREKVEMEARLAEMINHREDRIMIVDTGSTDSKNPCSFEFMGQTGPLMRRGTVII